jgi:hypothetical protein
MALVKVPTWPQSQATRMVVRLIMALADNGATPEVNLGQINQVLLAGSARLTMPISR